MLLICSQVRSTDEIARQDFASGKVALPVVFVLSVKVPSALATKVPVVVSEPTTGTVGQPRLAKDTSMSPDIFRHDDVTFQAPTTLPPHGVTLVQLAVGPPPPPLGRPPVLLAPPLELPPVEAVPAPPGESSLMLQAVPAASAASTKTPKNHNCPFRTVVRDSSPPFAVTKATSLPKKATFDRTCTKC